MKTYLISRTDQIDWDEYDSFVVRAENEASALELCKKRGSNRYGRGVFNEDNVEIQDIETIEESGVILGSFNAG